MAAGGYDPDRAARILVDAAQFGDRKTAESWGITEKTIGNYRRRMSTDASLSDLFLEKKRAADASWQQTRIRCIRKGIDRLEVLFGKADQVEHIEVVSRAIERLGNLDVASKVLDVGDYAYQPRPVASEDANGASEGEDAAGEEGRPGNAQASGH
jgi:hypothetical protein